MTDALAKRLSVHEVVALYEQAERDIRQAFKLIADADKVLREHFEYACVPSRHVRWDDVDDTLTETRRQVWRGIVDRLELRRIMSVRAWNELEQQINRGEVPEITIETVAAMGKQFGSQMSAMHEEAVMEVYEWLRPWHHDPYKTNSHFEIGPRVIKRGVVGREFYCTGWRVNYHREPQLTALENVFTALDGKGTINKGHYSLLSQAIRDAKDGHGETEYFEFRCCKNGNLHLRFKREDLLARLNQIAGGNRLRGERKSA